MNSVTKTDCSEYVFSCYYGIASLTTAIISILAMINQHKTISYQDDYYSLSLYKPSQVEKKIASELMAFKMWQIQPIKVLFHIIFRMN